ncbi:hypothetical protein H257_04866 [Aphanomyces astaci]|uniref:Uncharacterized protein n=1 Tax=Aphanomyces astaci TaxID=112090 RepID=W4GT39_APHAT|nr:hypothetical protein H257_04866 [Aphanomyces astaci]ETV82144.1 hypothetical protein H257_04866 [Aphanomyces astaci]|eukprot:XP_009827813.1 hypothetical protein H257_04866 [Aphanomyces astaci]
MLVVLWTMLTAGVMRRLWIYRNKVKYEGTAGPYVPVMLELVLLQWTMQVRRHLQLPTTLDDERTQIQTVLRHFGQHPSYHGFWSKYPLHFSVNPLVRRLPLR